MASNLNNNGNKNIGCQKITLRNLDTNLINVFVVGIIIGKQRPRKFENKFSNTGTAKAVWNFTFRDSIQDYANVTFWGPPEQVFSANDKFRSGDVVEIINPKISVRSAVDYGERFRPMVTSPYNLTLNETSDMILHMGDKNKYTYLLSYPTKPTAVFVPIQDLHNNGPSFKGTYVDILAAVRGVGAVRSVTTKQNELLHVREIEVFDHTSPSLKVHIWEPDIIQRSNNWKPRSTILFLTDLRVEWSDFEKAYTVAVTGRSIITENPNSKETEILRQYAENAPIDTSDIVDQIVTALPEPNMIQDVMSVKQLQDQINHRFQFAHGQSANHPFTAVLFAFISHFDLDGFTRSLSMKCSKCKMPIKGSVCENEECPVVFDKEYAEPEVSFDISVAITDHTGTLPKCQLKGQVAEAALHCTAKQFANMSDDQKCALKWKYLFERCTIKVAVVFMRRQNPVIIILSTEPANILEVTRRLPIY